MKKILLLSLLVFTALNASAQRDFRPGYILQQSDTLKGWINYRTAKANASVCQFKPALKADVQEFRASEISGYGFSEGMHYRSRLLNEITSSLPSQKMAPKFYFLNELVSGKADLYFVRDISGKNRFFLQKDTVFNELRSEVVRLEDRQTGVVYQGNSNQYIGTMSYLLNDCITLQPTINAAKFGPASLTQTISAYNQCIHPDSLYFAQPPKKIVTTFGITLGPVFTNVNLRHREKDPPTTINRNSGYAAGITMNNTLPFLNEKLSFQTELLLVKNNINLETNFTQQLHGATGNDDLIYYHLESTLTRYAVKVPVQLRYTFNFQKLRPYLSSGIILTKNTKTPSDLGMITAVYKQNQQSSSYPGFYPRPLHGNITAGTGVLFNFRKDLAVFAELKYVPEGIRSLYEMSADVNSWILSTGFRF